MTAAPEGMTYADYLQLDTLLSAQRPLSGLHDETLFIVMHQTIELWMKQSLHELGLACAEVRGDRFASAYKSLARLGRIQAVMTLSWDVLATMTPVDYTAFRNVLGTSSGFQSAQFRELEFRLGIKNPKYLGYHEGGSEGHARLVAAPPPGRLSIATASAGSNCTSSPRSWSMSTTRSPAGGTSMC